MHLHPSAMNRTLGLVCQWAGGSCVTLWASRFLNEEALGRSKQLKSKDAAIVLKTGLWRV